MSSQFLVDSIIFGGDENLIRGICGLGSISVGQAFLGLLRTEVM